MSPPTDVLILGAGPAALALSAHAARAGLSVRVIAPDPDAAWVQCFGAWEDEIAPLGPLPVAQRWAAPTVFTPVQGERVLGRRYARLDTPALQARLRDEAGSAGVRFERGRAAAIAHELLGSEVRTSDGRTLRGRIVVDATGNLSPFVARTGGHRPGFQVAWGERVEVEDHPWLPGEMVFMDVTPAGSDDPTEEVAPTFLYAMPESRNVVFVEETSLVRRPALSYDMLSYRLRARLERMGIRARRVLGRERCRIAMGGGLPRASQRVVGFGAAGGLVHPATGYQLARTLGAAPGLAAALARGLEGEPAAAAWTAWRALWPKPRRRAWELYQFGMDAICRLDAPGLGAFLESFFALPRETWAGFLSGTLAPDEVRGAMAGLFRNAPVPLRRSLVETGASPAVLSLFRSLWAA